MATIDRLEVQGGSGGAMAAQKRPYRLFAYAAVIFFGLAAGAIIGLVTALFFNLISISC
jgi:hypothetical protein